MRVVRWISLVLWVATWILMAFEVFRWHHLTPTLRYNTHLPPGPYGPGHLGLPAQAARAVAVAAPVVFVATVVWSRAYATTSPDVRNSGSNSSGASGLA